MRSLAAALVLIASAARAEDTAAPTIDHKPVTRTERGAKFVIVFATVNDESKTFPQTFYRYGPGEYQKPLDMKQVKGSKNQYGANIPVKGDLVEYYIEAYDEYGNGPGRSGAPETPWRVDTSGAPEVAAAPPPPPRREPPPPVRREPPPPQPVAQASGGRTWTWIVGGLGLGALGGGLWTGAIVKTEDDAYAKHLGSTQPDYASLKAQYDANRSLGMTSTVLTIGGGVLVATSIILFFVESPGDAPKKGARSENDGDRSINIAAAPLEGGAAVAVAGRF